MLLAGGIVAASACLDPTQATFEVTTNVACGPDVRAEGSLYETGLVVGTRAEVGSAELQSTTRACTPGEAAHRIGDIVIVPEDGATEARALFVGGVGAASAEDCLPFARGAPAPAVGQCIVARRRVAFVDNADLQIPVFLDLACANERCAEDTTCRFDGATVSCVDAAVVCRGDECGIDGGAGATTSSSATAGGASDGGGGAGGAGGEGGEGGAGGQGAAGGAGGGGAGGGVDVVIEPIYEDANRKLKLITAEQDGSGDEGLLIGVLEDQDGTQRISDLSGAADLLPGLSGITQVDVRAGIGGRQVAAVGAGGARLSMRNDNLVPGATDVAIFDDGVYVVFGDAEIRRYTSSESPAELLGTGPQTSWIDTFDGARGIAVGTQACIVPQDGEGEQCIAVADELGQLADVSVAPHGMGVEAFLVAVDGTTARVRIAAEFVDFQAYLDIFLPPTDGLELTSGRVTIGDEGVMDGGWVAGARLGDGFLARGRLLASAAMQWTVIPQVASLGPIRDVWVHPRDGDVAYVVTTDGRLLSVRLL